MSLEITSLSRAVLEASELLYTKLSAKVTHQNLVPTQAIKSVNPVASNISIIENSDNQIIHEVSHIIESSYLNIGKNLSDATNLSDLIALEIEKGAADILGIYDQHSVSFNKVFRDNSEVTEFITFFLHKGLSDIVTSTDYLSLGVTKILSEDLSMADEFVCVVNFVRHFHDFISLDDFNQIDKYFSGVKHNVLGLQDNNILEFVKERHDLISLGDLPTWIMDKKLNDVLSLPDSLSKIVNTSVSNDFLALTDLTQITSNKALQDVTSTPDSVMLLSVLGMNDTAVIGSLFKYIAERVVTDTTNVLDQISKDVINNMSSNNTTLQDVMRMMHGMNLSDAYSISDDSVLSVVKYITDSVNIADSMDISTNLVKLDSVAIDDIFLASRMQNIDKHNAAFIADSERREIQKKFNDVTTLGSFLRMVHLKELEDSVGVSDSFAVEIIRGGSSMFNASMFNQSTFG